MLLETIAGSSRMALYAVVFWYESIQSAITIITTITITTTTTTTISTYAAGITRNNSNTNNLYMHEGYEEKKRNSVAFFIDI